MAGSRQTFLYETDPQPGGGQPNTYLITADESNMLLLGYQPSSGPANPIPTVLRIRPRYILLVGRTADDQPLTRRWPVLDIDNQLFQQGGILNIPVLVNGALANVTFRVSGSVGESKTFVQAAFDTGQDDGTNP